MSLKTSFFIFPILFLAAACSSTKQFSALDFKPPTDDYSLIVMRPEVSVGSVTTGGMVERRDDWTEDARRYILAALAEQQSAQGASVTIAHTREQAGGDPELVTALTNLHKAVGYSINLHKYQGAELPTKEDKFNWTLGEAAVEYGIATGYDYALFLNAEDSFASTGRKVVQGVGVLGCAAFALCLIADGGDHTAFASLVDLKTGQIVWYNVLSSSEGDVRNPKGAQKMIDELLGKMKPGEAVNSSNADPENS